MSRPFFLSPGQESNNMDEEESQPLTPQIRHENDEEWTPKPFFSLSNMKFVSQSSIHNSRRSNHKAPSNQKEPPRRSVAAMAHAAFSMERLPTFRRQETSPVEDLVEDMHKGTTSTLRQRPPDVSLFDAMSPEPSAPLEQSMTAPPPPSAPGLDQLDRAEPLPPGGAYIYVSPAAEQSIAPSLSQLTSPSFSVQSGVSQLHGLGIESPESEYTDVSINTTSKNGSRQYRRRVSFDLEANYAKDDWTRASSAASSSRQISVVEEESDMESSINSQPHHSGASQMAHIMSQIPLRAWTRRLNVEVNRVNTVTTRELRHVSQVVSNTTIRVLGLSTVLQNLNDLKYLEEKHAEKMGCIRKVHTEEHYDFALVLTVQEVYAFWTEHLDFRTEYLGEDSAEKPSPDGDKAAKTVETDSSIPSEGTIDARPFVTPFMGIRNRKGRTAPKNGMTEELPKDDELTPLRAPHTAPERSSRAFFSRGLSSAGGSGRPTLKKRMSLFDRAVDAFSPTSRGSSFRGAKVFSEDQSSPTPKSQKKLNPSMSSARRRRWGNRAMSGTVGSSMADLMSPPVRSLKRSPSIRKRLAKNMTPSRPSELKEDVTPGSKRQRLNRNSLCVEDIPTQVIPRGIAARTHGMERFLSALKRGITVRRHRPNAEAVFCKIISNDGGDTIQYQHIDTEEAMLGFKEQRVRYNRKLGRKGSPSYVRSISKRWSYRELPDNEDEMQAFSLPDFIAARQYRQRQMEMQGGLKKKVVDIATQVANSGSVHTKHLIAVHPARHEDPRSEMAEFGSVSLRKSKSEYYAPHSFSLVTNTGRHWLKGQSSNKVASEKWHSGEGPEAHFRYVDFEAATEGEYWLIFRGFLLLHRDAASGRFAQQRAAGFGSNYSGREQDLQTSSGSSEEEGSDDPIPDGNRLPKERFHEPPTVSWLEYLVAKLRKTDMSYMTGHAVDGATPPPSDYFLGFRSPGTQIWSRLRQAGLETQRIYALDSRRVMIKVQCPSDRLMDVAEVLRLKLKARDGSFVPFRENSLAIFRPSDEPWSPYEDGAALFRSSERQTIIDFIIRSRIRDSGAELGQNTDLGKMVDRRVPLHMRERLYVLYYAWVYFWKRSNWIGRDGRSMTDGSEKTDVLPKGASSNSLRLAPSHDQSEIESQLPPDDAGVPRAFYRLLRGCLHQPLDSVEQYFGEKVAYYFVWLQHCSNHLIVLSVVGLIVFICQLSSGRWDHPIRPFFSVVVMLWSFVVLSNWRKRSNFLAYRWGTMNLKEQETTRPQFKGEYRRDEITGEWVVYYPSWKRWLKYLISFPLTLAFTAGTLTVILLVHANRDVLLARYYEQKTNPEFEQFSFEFSASAIGQRAPINAVELNKEVLTDPTFWVIIGGLPAALGLCLPLLNLLLMRVSVMLNDFENYRTASEYRTHLIIKVFSFRFVCYFSALYYYAYISVGSDQAIENGILRVGTGVFVYMTVAHWWSVFLSVYFPLFLFHVRRYFHKMNLLEKLRDVEMQELMLSDVDEESEDVKARKIQLINKRILLEQAQSDIWEEVMLREHDSFPEYIQAVVQFAYVSCFSVVFPLAPLICLINHLMSMRFDAYKLCRGRRRPLVQKTGGIGVWEHVLHIVTVIAVLTNCFLMGFTNYLFRDIADQVGSLGLFCIVVGWEHIMLLIKYVMHTTISKFPKSVRDEMKKEQYKLERQRNSSMRAKKGRRSKNKKSGSSNKRRDSDDQSFASSQILQQNSLQETVSFEESVQTFTSEVSEGDQSELSSLLGPNISSRENDAPNQYLPSSLKSKGSKTENAQPRSYLRPLNHQQPSSATVRATPSMSNTVSRSATERGKNGDTAAPTPRQLHLDGEVSQYMDSPFGMFMPADKIKNSPIPRKDTDEHRVSDVLQSFLQEDASDVFEDDEGSDTGRYYEA